MQEGLRSTGIEVIGDASWGTHFCQFYQTQQDLLDLLVPYFKSGLANNEFCMWITSEPLGAGEAEEAMRKALPDLDRYLESGQLEILPHSDWYLKDGIFDSQRVLAGWLDKLERARAKGYDGLRLTGNTFWLEKSDWENFTHYEETIDIVIGHHRMIAVCTYCLDRCSAAEVIDVIRNHRFALIKREGRWEVVQSAERKRAEEVRAHLATIVQSSSDAIIGKSLDGTITSWNPGAERLYGYKAEEVIGKSIALLIPPELPGELHSILERVSRGEVIQHHETMRVRKDGSRIDVSTGVSPIRDRQGRVIAAAAIARDMTERRRTEAERERLYQAEHLAHAEVEAARRRATVILESITDAFFALDHEWRFTYVNAQAERLLLRPRDTLLGKSVWDEFPEAVGSTFWLEYHRAVSEPVSVSFEEYYPPLRTWFEVHAFPSTEGLSVYFQDINDRKRAEAERESLLADVARRAAELEAVVENTQAQLALLDQDFNFLMVNSAYTRGSGHSKEELLGRNHFELFPNAENQSIFERVRDTGVPYEAIEKAFEYLDQPGRGVTYWNWILAPIKDETGTVREMLLSLLDVTGQVRARQQVERLAEESRLRAAELEASNQELEAFSYSVSHDLRAPLRGIDGFSQALLEDCAGKLDEQGREYLQVLRSESQRMAALIDALLTLSRVSRAEMRRQEVDLSALAQKIAGDLQRAEPERSVEFAIAPGLVAIGDPRLLQVALENLLANAWKFTARHPRARIEFGALQQEGKPIYFVRDDGAGFDMAYAGKLFGAFQRLHSQNEFSGTGIGLATVQRIVRRHGGRIWAEGQVERGATFYFTL